MVFFFVNEFPNQIHLFQTWTLQFCPTVCLKTKDSIFPCLLLVGHALLYVLVGNFGRSLVNNRTANHKLLIKCMLDVVKLVENKTTVKANNNSILNHQNKISTEIEITKATKCSPFTLWNPYSRIYCQNASLSLTNKLFLLGLSKRVQAINSWIKTIRCLTMKEQRKKKAKEDKKQEIEVIWLHALHLEIIESIVLQDMVSP